MVWGESPLRYTSELDNVRVVIEYLVNLYGIVAGAEFGPKMLKAFRQTLIDKPVHSKPDVKLSRSTINRHIGTVKRIFRWAASEELIGVEVYQRLATVPGLRKGKSDARETPPVEPVPLEDVAKVLPELSRPVRALVELQLLTAARPGELLRLRPMDIDASGEVWTARLSDHKTAYAGKRRVLHFGPRAQAILKQFMLRAADEPMFSPREVMPEIKSNQREIGKHYTTDSYRRAVIRACKRAKITPFHPHQLRHSAGTRIRAEFGLDHAQVALGHSNAKITEVYAVADGKLAEQIAQALG